MLILKHEQFRVQRRLLVAFNGKQPNTQKGNRVEAGMGRKKKQKQKQKKTKKQKKNKQTNKQVHISIRLYYDFFFKKNYKCN